VKKPPPKKKQASQDFGEDESEKPHPEAEKVEQGTGECY